MNEFSISTLNQSAIQYLHSIKDSIWLDPPYQRISDIWSLDKRQLLIDSIINRFDIPKFYFHELVPAKKAKGTLQKYSIIDGKQRLEAIWSFIDGGFKLADDFEYLHEESVQLGGLTYLDLAQKHPLIKSRFDGTSLSVVAVRTDDIELIDDMFSRLNEAVPLNAPEKRNAFPGSLPKTIRDLAEHSFFKTKVQFKDSRYKYRDLAAKLLMIEHRDSVVDTKKIYLDTFVRKWSEDEKTAKEADTLRTNTEGHLDRMTEIFVDGDPLLKSIGMTILIFHFFRLLGKTSRISKIRREHFQRFEDARMLNRTMAEVDLAKADYDLLEFDKYVQTPNDAFATRLRLSIMINFLRAKLKFDLPASCDQYFAPVT